LIVFFCLVLFRDSFYMFSLPCLYCALLVQSHVSEVSVFVCFEHQL